MDKEFVMTVDAPYPRNMDPGIIHGYAKKFDTPIKLEQIDEKCRSKGDLQCIYHIVIEVYATD